MLRLSVVYNYVLRIKTTQNYSLSASLSNSQLKCGVVKRFSRTGGSSVPVFVRLVVGVKGIAPYGQGKKGV